MNRKSALSGCLNWVTSSISEIQWFFIETSSTVFMGITGMSPSTYELLLQHLCWTISSYPSRSSLHLVLSCWAGGGWLKDCIMSGPLALGWVWSMGIRERGAWGQETDSPAAALCMHPWKTSISTQPSLLGSGNIPSSLLFRCRYWPSPTPLTCPWIVTIL